MRYRLLLIGLLGASLQAGAAAPPAQPPIFIEVQAEPQNPYVQSQVLYTVRVLYTLTLLEGSLEAPALPQAEVERLGEDGAYETVRDGRNYRVIERRYALFPQTSGVLTIPSVQLHGRIRADAGAHLGAVSEQIRPIQLSSEPVILEVRPRPPGYAGAYWLPSTGLSLQESWPEQPAVWRVGEPVAWVMTLVAQGLDAAQLPDLSLPENDAVRLYPDRPVAQNRITGQGVVGYREQRLALIPLRAGELRLPEVRLSWWDTTHDREQTATLPARAVTVLPAAPPAPTPPPEFSLAAAPPALVGKSADPFWPGVVLLLLGLWLGTLLAWRRAHRRQTPAAVADARRSSASPGRQALRQACRANDPAAAAAALLKWAADTWPEPLPRTLLALAERLPGDSAAVRELDRALYAPAPPAWQGDALWRAVQSGLLQPPPTALPQQDLLPPLYPVAAPDGEGKS